MIGEMIEWNDRWSSYESSSPVWCALGALETVNYVCLILGLAVSTHYLDIIRCNRHHSENVTKSLMQNQYWRSVKLAQTTIIDCNDCRLRCCVWNFFWQSIRFKNKETAKKPVWPNRSTKSAEIGPLQPKHENKEANSTALMLCQISVTHQTMTISPKSISWPNEASPWEV